ncbi:hypothetical protein ACTFIV_003564 [Dictyostelium citrinum]
MSSTDKSNENEVDEENNQNEMEQQEEEEEVEIVENSLYLESFNWNELNRETNKDNVDKFCDVHDGEEHSFEELASFYAICIRDQFNVMRDDHRDLRLHRITFVAKSKYSLYSRLLPYRDEDFHQKLLLYSNSYYKSESDDNIVIFSKESIDFVKYYFQKYYGNSKYLNNWTVFGNSDQYYCNMITFK